MTMNRLAMIAALGSLSVLGFTSAGASDANVCAGTWKLEFVTPMGPQEALMNLTQEGEQVTGKSKDPMGGDVDVTGTCKGDVMELSQKVNSPMGELVIEFIGKVSGTSVSGNVIFGDFGGGDFTGTKQ